MDFEEIGKENRYIRGYILRSLAIGQGNRAAVRQIASGLITMGRILSPDISKHVDYLIKAGYVNYVNQKITAYSKYADDGVIELTKEGQDLVDGTIEDNGVEL